jgi:hypothetical protein
MGSTPFIAVATVLVSVLTNAAIGVLFQDYLRVPQWTNVALCVLLVGLSVPAAIYSLSKPKGIGQAPLRIARRWQLVQAIVMSIALLPSITGVGWMWHRADALASWPVEFLRADFRRDEQICGYDAAQDIWGNTNITLKLGTYCDTYMVNDRDLLDRDTSDLLPRHVVKKWNASYGIVSHYPHLLIGDQEVLTYLELVPYSGAGESTHQYFSPLNDEQAAVDSVGRLATQARLAAGVFAVLTLVLTVLLVRRPLRWITTNLAPKPKPLPKRGGGATRHPRSRRGR